MHKTLYIDADEEITSVIDRLRKAGEREVIIVAPKNAMLLQSIVNLKLLKKEADRRKKQLLIITQDKIGKKLIEKAGIQAQAKAGKDLYADAEPEEKAYAPMYAAEASEIKEALEKEEAEKEIGTSDYFDEPIEKQPEAPEDRPSDGLKMKKSKEEKSLRDEPKKAAKGNKGKEEKSRVNMSDIVLNQSPPKRKKTEPDPKAEQFLAERQDEQSEEIRYSEQFPQVYAEVNAEPPKISQVSIKKAEKFFRGARRSKKDLEVARVGGGAKKYFIFFISLFIFLAALAAAYFLLPKATLALQAKNQTKSVALDLTAAAQNSANASGNALRANLEQTNKDFAEDFEVTGSKDGGAKAAGQVVIYNEFSSADQPLIATTRLETSDGKIFRITKDVVVPGSTNVGGETKPGAIGVDVVADQPGDSFNIDPSDFKISGFKSTPAKFDKFYAKSTKAMAGGSAGAAKAVTAQDIASAREKIAADAKKAAIQELKSSLPPGRKIFEDSVQVAVSNISVSDTVGVQKDKLSATAKIQASALSFEESDVKDLMKNSLVQSGASQNEISFDQPINYVISDSNIQQKTLKFQAATDARIGADLDLDNFKKGILGKTEEDAQIYAKNFPAIQKMDISFWPFFVKRLPLSEGRIEITTN